jgi:sugar O-acyltransferase (sialic acid O-acetyltransferase NeuD family)
VKDEIVIVGHGGLGREVASLVQSLNQSKPVWVFRGFISSTSASVGQKVGSHLIFADDQWLATTTTPLACVIAIGDHRVASRLNVKFDQNPQLSFPNLVHPANTGDWPRIKMGKGNIVLNGVAFTTDIALGNFNIINPGCTVSHDCILGNHNLLGPGVHLGGGAKVGNRVLLGVGATVLPGLSIADDVIVGGGAVVAQSIATPGNYAGVPARRL